MTEHPYPALHGLISVMVTKMKKSGIPIGSFDAIANAAGKMTVKPKVSRKTPVNQKIAQRKSKRVRVVKGGQRP